LHCRSENMFDLTMMNFEKVINDLGHDVDKNLKVS